MAKENLDDFQIEDVNSDFLFDIYVDVQNRLHIVSKAQKPTLPKYVAVSKLPDIEMFMPSLEKELAEKDITPEERARMAAEEQARIEAEQRAKEEAERKAREEAEAKARAEEEARLAAEQKAREEEEARIKAEEEARLAAEEQARIEAEEKAKAEAEAQAKAEEEARLAEEQAKLEAEKKAQEEAEAQAKAEQEARIAAEEEAKAQAEADKKAKEEAEAQAKAEEEARLAAEEQAKAEAEAKAREEEEARLAAEAEAKAQEAAKAPTPSSEKISVISFETLKGKKKPLVSRSAMQTGGIAIAKAEALKQKSEIDAIRKEEAQERAAKRKIEKEQEALSRLPNAILIGNTKAPSPELGKFEIVASNDQEKPFKFVLKTELGKVVFETSPMKTKPNELTAVMFKDIMKTGSFTFTRSVTGAIVFKILDSRQRVFYTSRSYMSVQDAQRAAALIKKYGLSANYIDDTTI